MAARRLGKASEQGAANHRSRRRRSTPARLPAYAVERSQPVPLRAILNFGPVTSAELASLGIVTLDDLERLGAEDALRRWAARFPDRLNVNAALGLVVTLDGGVWTSATHAQRAAARQLVDRLRVERGLPPAKASSRPRHPVRRASR